MFYVAAIHNNPKFGCTDSAALDISADLRELGRTPVAVVSAGVKSILDIGRTLEYLVGVIYSSTNLAHSSNINTTFLMFE